MLLLDFFYGPALDGIFRTFCFREFRKCSAFKVRKFFGKNQLESLVKSSECRALIFSSPYPFPLYFSCFFSLSLSIRLFFRLVSLFILSISPLLILRFIVFFSVPMKLVPREAERNTAAVHNTLCTELKLKFKLFFGNKKHHFAPLK